MITNDEINSSEWTQLNLSNKINRINQEIEAEEGEIDKTFQTQINNFLYRRRMILPARYYVQEINYQQDNHQKGDVIFIY